MDNFKRVIWCARISLLLIQAFILCLPPVHTPICAAVGRREKASRRPQKERRGHVS